MYNSIPFKYFAQLILRLCCRHWPCCFEVSLEKSWKLLSNVKLLFLLYVQKSLKRNGSQLHSLSIFQIGRFSFTFNCLILNVRCIHFYRIMRISFWISLFKDRSYLSSSMYIHMKRLDLESKNVRSWWQIEKGGQSEWLI